MKIEYLQITIVPFYMDEEKLEADVVLKTNGKYHRFKQVYPVDHFEDMFSRFMRDAKLSIKELLDA